MAELHLLVGLSVIALNLAAGVLGGFCWFRERASVPFWYLLRAAQVAVFIQVDARGAADLHRSQARG